MTGLVESLTGFTLLVPHFLWLVLLVPAAFAWRALRGAPAAPFGPAAFAFAAPRTWRVRLRPLPIVLVALGLAIVPVALARPVSFAPLPPEREGIDVLLCVDTSSSMTATDLDPVRTRLEVVKDAAARFVAGRPNDRIGLVTFARYADLRGPLTLDHRALGEILAAVEPVENDGPEDATAIGAAVARAAEALAHRQTRSRVVILLTDGEENVATADQPDEIAPTHAGQLCRELGVRVYAIAAGLGRRTIDGAWRAIDARAVRELAAITGGRFFEARDASALDGVYAAIDAMERVEFAESRFTTEEGFAAVLVLAIVLIGLGELLGSTLLAELP